MDARFQNLLMNPFSFHIQKKSNQVKFIISRIYRVNSGILLHQFSLWPQLSKRKQIKQHLYHYQHHTLASALFNGTQLSSRQRRENAPLQTDFSSSFSLSPPLRRKRLQTKSLRHWRQRESHLYTLQKPRPANKNKTVIRNKQVIQNKQQ